MNMKKALYIIFGMLLGGSAYGQQEIQVSQYMFNGLLLNPAYAGSHQYFSSSLLHRSQWVNFDKAPTTQVFGIDGPIAKDRLGVGLHVTNDRHGVISQLEIGGDLAWRTPLGPGNLALGVRANVASYSANLSDVTVWDENDEVYSFNDYSGELVTKFGFGAYYNTDRWYVGVSVPVIYSLDDKILPAVTTNSSYFTQHYYLNGGAVFDINYNVAVKPSILLKYTPAAPAEVDINCNFLLFQRLWLGAGWRSGDAVIAMIEYNITPQLRAGYAYDFTTTEIRQYSSGSHEIMLGFDFGKNVDIKKRSPRYF